MTPAAIVTLNAVEEHEVSSIHPALEGCIESLSRCIQLATMLTPAEYRAEVPGVHSIGGHLRHCIDHVKMFLRGFARGEVDYDSRERDPELEKAPQKFIEQMESHISQLLALDAEDLESSVDVVCIPGTGLPKTRIASTWARELNFLSTHTIHHIAIIQLIARIIGVELPSELGLAYSTADYRAKRNNKSEAGSCAL